SIAEATSEVFMTMLDMSIDCTGPANDSRPADSGVVALVGITGDWGGSGVFFCSPAFAAIISARMLGCSPDPAHSAIDEEVLDVVAELTNMMVGNIKNGLEPFTGPLAISVPTVIHGRTSSSATEPGCEVRRWVSKRSKTGLRFVFPLRRPINSQWSGRAFRFLVSLTWTAKKALRGRQRPAETNDVLTQSMPRRVLVAFVCTSFGFLADLKGGG